MNNYAIFTVIWTNVAVPVNTATGQMITALTGIIGPEFRACVMAYFMISFLIAAYSPDDNAWLDFLKKLGLAAVIYTLATNAGTFNYYVTGVAQGVVNTITQAIAGMFGQGAGPLNANSFDVVALKAFSVGAKIFKDLPWYSPKIVPLGMVCIVYWGLSLGAIVVMFSVYLVSYVATQFLIGIGPVFVALYFFPYTRGWFDGWLSNLMTGVLVQIFSAALATMFVAVLGNVFQMMATGLAGTEAGQVDGSAFVGEIMMMFVAGLACCIFGILSVMMMHVAESIAGGVHSEVSRLSQIAQGLPGRGPGGARGGAGAAGSAGAGSPGGTPGGQPARAYAFNSTPGSAP